MKLLVFFAKQIWYADDATAIGRISNLRMWWDKLNEIGPKFGYFTNPLKTWLVVKEEHLNLARTIFHNTDIQLTVEGRPLLGSAIGTKTYLDNYVTSKVKAWSQSLKTLSSFAVTQPHASYAVFTHGFSNLWTFISRTTPDISNLLLPLDKIITDSLIPNLTGRLAPNHNDLAVFALPARLGGLNISLPSSSSDKKYTASLSVTSALTHQVLAQNFTYDPNIYYEQIGAKNQIRIDNNKQSTTATDQLLPLLPQKLQKSITLARQKGASAWLTCLPIQEHGFTLHKSAFIDAIALRYGWTPPRLPPTCSCGNNFNIEHAFSCNKGGLPSIRHNELRDLTAGLLSVVCHDVSIEPELQPITNEDFVYSTANRQDGARLDIVANGLWGGRFERTYFDVRVFNPLAPSYYQSDLSSTFRLHERAKKREYGQRVLDVEHSSFTPLVFSATGGLGPEADTCYKRLATLLCAKWNNSYNSTLRWLRCRLSFSLLRSAIQSIRGSRSSPTCRPNLISVDLVNRETLAPHVF